MSFCSMEEYIDSLSEEGKKYVKWFVEFMEEEYPQLKAKISFSMPMWWKGEKMRDGYVAVSAAKNHVSIHFSDENFVGFLCERLPDSKRGKRCVNICYRDDASFQTVLEGVKQFLG